MGCSFSVPVSVQKLCPNPLIVFGAAAEMVGLPTPVYVTGCQF